MLAIRRTVIGYAD